MRAVSKRIFLIFKNKNSTGFKFPFSVSLSALRASVVIFLHNLNSKKMPFRLRMKKIEVEVLYLCAL
jgi:hypothetical protein